MQTFFEYFESWNRSCYTHLCTSVLNFDTCFVTFFRDPVPGDDGVVNVYGIPGLSCMHGCMHTNSIPCMHAYYCIASPKCVSIHTMHPIFEQIQCANPDKQIYWRSFIYLFKQLVSRHNVNRTKIHTEESQARISHTIYTKCLLNKNVFKLRLNEARVNWSSVISYGKLFHIFEAEKQKARLPNTVLGVKHWRSLWDADRICLWGWW